MADLSRRRTSHRRRSTQPARPPAFLYLLLLIVLFNFFARACAGRDFYDILGIPREADSAMIKRAFRKLAVKYHPGMSPEGVTQLIYQSINCFLFWLFC